MIKTVDTHVSILQAGTHSPIIVFFALIAVLLLFNMLQTKVFFLAVAGIAPILALPLPGPGDDHSHPIPNM